MNRLLLIVYLPLLLCAPCPKPFPLHVVQAAKCGFLVEIHTAHEFECMLVNLPTGIAYSSLMHLP